MPTQPPDLVVSEENVPDDTVIWRYMQFHRFVEIIEKHQIWFTRPIIFDDRWEGLFPPSYVRRTRQYAKANGIPYEEFDRDFRKRMQRHRCAKFVNCWQIGEYESDAMWRLYGNGSKAIAIRSTVGSVRECLRLHGDGKVIYYDPSHDILSESFFGPHDILFKRESFRWESEYRFWIDDDELLDRIEIGEMIDESTLSARIPISLGDTTKLIQAVVVPPGASDEYIEEVKAACERVKRTWMWKRIERSYSDRMWDDFTR